MRPSAGQAIAGGLVGTIAITALMYWVAPILVGMPMDIAKMLGDYLGIGWGGGMAVHIINGAIIFPLIYAFVLYAWLPGRPIVKGMTWGLILWVLAQTIVMPVLGGGFFSANAGGPMAAIGSFAGHLIYGGALGAIASVEHGVATPA
jgi:hypothetical protein